MTKKTIPSQPERLYRYFLAANDNGFVLRYIDPPPNKRPSQDE